MTQGDPWDAFPVGIPSTSQHTGPFPHRPFLAAVERAAGTPPEAILVEADAHGAIALVDDGIVRMAGPPDLTDYHSPLGDDPDVVAHALSRLRGRAFRFDSLPADARDLVVAGVRAVGVEPDVSEHESTAVLELPGSLDDWLASIGKKERHEVRRKRRRFVTEFGDIEVVRRGIDAAEHFYTMHRTSQGDKGGFMTDRMRAFFSDLLVTADAVIHDLVCDGIVRASAFGFETPSGYYYYNSAYDPDAAMASPGVVLFSSMIEDQIRRGAKVFDFLKGDERYKYRHGATPRSLFVVEGQVP
jgi:CelD/BcsL family acetyltransferase involved in cellulose biosynthesis